MDPAFIPAMLHALVVGVNTYTDEKIPDLRYARADAQAVARLIEERVEGQREVSLLLDEQATKAQIAHVLQTELPRRVGIDDDVLLYFAGHGSPEIEASRGDPSIYAITHDTEYARLASTAINMVSELAAWVRRLPARRVFLVVDASFNGAPGGRTFEGPHLWSGPRTRRLDRVSLSRLAFGTRGVLLAAAGDKEAACEEAAYQHGVFTYHLLEIMGRSPTVSIAALHDAVASAVRGATKGAQNPTLHATHAAHPLFTVGHHAARAS